MKTTLMIHLALLVTLSNAAELTYPIVDTGQIRCYNNSTEITYPAAGLGYFGQDVHYSGNQPAYKDNGDGTVTDLNTGLMWTQDPGRKKTFEQAVAGASLCKVGGHTDWRLPTIKVLYSLILFSGTDPVPMSTDTSAQRPFIDTNVFKFKYGDPQQGERVIDSQFATSTLYRSTTMKGDKTLFGVNFADGRIKGYGLVTPRGEKTFYVLYVRGNPLYGKNDFHDNGNGTVTDNATGLMWMKADSGKAMNWRQALKWAEDLEYGGYSDWRLPNAKELQSIVDYSRCPDVTNSAAINNLVRCVRGGKAELRTTGPEIEMKRARQSNTGRNMQGPPTGPEGMQPPPRGGPGQDPSGADFIQRLDRDGDGKVSKQEFDGPTRHFTQLDRNKDGYLSQAEAPQGPPPQQNNRRRR